MSDIQSQCWICPLCHDDKHHQSGDAWCLTMQASGYQGLLIENEQLRARVAEYEKQITYWRSKAIDLGALKPPNSELEP